MSEKKKDEIESGSASPPLDWNHPLVKAGFVPGHLLCESFGYHPDTWSTWCNKHRNLFKPMNRQPWFNLAKFIAWTATVDADELPPMAADEPNAKSRAKGKRST